MKRFEIASVERRQHITELYEDIKKAKAPLDIIKEINAAECATLTTSVAAAEQEVNAAFDALEAIFAEQRRAVLATIRKETNIQKLEDASAEIERIIGERDEIEPKIGETAENIQHIRTADVLSKSAEPEKVLATLYAVAADALKNFGEVQTPVNCDAKVTESVRDTLKKGGEKYANVTFKKVHSVDGVLCTLPDDGVGSNPECGFKVNLEWTRIPSWISKIVGECPNAFYGVKCVEMTPTTVKNLDDDDDDDNDSNNSSDSECDKVVEKIVALTKDTSYTVEHLEKNTTYKFTVALVIKASDMNDDITTKEADLSSKVWTLWGSNEVTYATTQYTGAWTLPNRHYEIKANGETGRPNVVARLTDDSSNFYAVYGDTPLIPGIINRFGIRFNEHNCRRRMFIGVAPMDSNFGAVDLQEKSGYYMDTNSRDLTSGPPFKYDGRTYPGVRSVYITQNEVVGVVVDLASPVATVSFVVNGHELGVAYSGIPKDVPLVPVVVAREEGDEVEILPNDETFIGASLVNRDGDFAFLGVEDDSCGGVLYCGLKKNQCRCGGCDGTCGPNNGCACEACDSLLNDLVVAAREHLKCEEGHSLRKVTLGDPTLASGYDGGYCCDVCEEDTSRRGRVFFHCDECTYDLCPNCAIKRVPKEFFRRGGFPVTKKDEVKK